MTYLKHRLIIIAIGAVLAFGLVSLAQAQTYNVFYTALTIDEAWAKWTADAPPDQKGEPTQGMREMHGWYWIDNGQCSVIQTGEPNKYEQAEMPADVKFRVEFLAQKCYEALAGGFK